MGISPTAALSFFDSFKGKLKSHATLEYQNGILYLLKQDPIRAYHELRKIIIEANILEIAGP